MKKLRRLIRILGPGFITGASDDDPSGIATYSQTGALFGFYQLWTAIFFFPFMAFVQEMCGRIGLVTGKGLAQLIRQHYSKSILYPIVLLLFIANTINIGADLGAMAASLELILKIPFLLWLFVVVCVILYLQVFIPYKRYVGYLKYLSISLFAYVFTAFLIKINWIDVIRSTFVPFIQFNSDYITNIVALLGTTISPYLFFWQEAEEVEEEVAHHRLKQMDEGLPKIYGNDVKKLRFDTFFGMFFSQLIMWFIIITTGATLFPSGIKTIDSAASAAIALKPLAGDFAFLLFALGIVGTGLLAIPILSGSASYAVSEVFGWKVGLYKTFNHAKGFYVVIVAATIIGACINFLRINPISALYYTAVINGVIAPILLVVILFIANNKGIMGNRTNGMAANVSGIITVVVMSVASFLLLLQFKK